MLEQIEFFIAAYAHFIGVGRFYVDYVPVFF